MALPFRFIHFNHLPECRAWVDKAFDGYFALNYAHSGRLSWRFGGGEPRELAGPVAWWTWPGPRFAYGCEKAPGWDHYYVTFSGSWARELARAGWFPADAAEPFRPIADPHDFCLKMTRLQEELARRDFARAWTMLLGLLLDVRESCPPSSRRQRLRDFAEAIRADPRRPWTEEEGMRLCAVSRPHFRRLFRETSGMPFRRFCLQARMDLAATLLRTGEPAIKEVASRCGVPDVYQFYRQFRKHHEMPPGEYRRALRLERPL